ncbi:hypothetical protein MWN34_10045 [Ancylobacter sp. 6x-1]|uniref:Uncharacterized protein n=1 Tax=Ancylobacter crimeensis TaxID=2579147 RepID=A0ABT0DBB4_9HYPH|nr:hypothetical protein [Ancylobacter crimeensis]MCK0197253.1 hypothetical protein [Ancylobacter crimeensis]
MTDRLTAGFLALALLGPVGAAQAQTPSFATTGFIESLALTTPGDPLSAGTMVVSNQPILLPRNLMVTMPGRYMTVQDLFRGPTGGAVGTASGLALLDATPPKVPFEAEVIGNIANGQYVAGVVRISQGALHAGAGFIQSIDAATGELRVGAHGRTDGARVRLNDETGIYGLRNGEGAKAAIVLDRRFALDPENSPIHAQTGFPVCVARPGGGDAACPAGNRPGGVVGLRFTCGPIPAAADAPPVPGCDPRRPAPLRVGDYVTYQGILVPDGANSFLIAAYALAAELGIYTSPQAEPVYLAIEEAIQGTKGEAFGDIPQEETTRFRIVGFTTDPSRKVEVRIVDSGRSPRDASGNELGTSFTTGTGLSPSNGPQLGRFRNTWPAKDDARAVRRDVLALVVGSSYQSLPNGLISGRYTAPMNEYIYPEPTSFGIRGFPVPVPFENFCFLQNGGGTMETDGGTVTLGRLDPFPDSGHPLSQPVGTGAARACDGQ